MFDKGNFSECKDSWTVEYFLGKKKGYVSTSSEEWVKQVSAENVVAVIVCKVDGR